MYEVGLFQEIIEGVGPIQSINGASKGGGVSYEYHDLEIEPFFKPFGGEHSDGVLE